MSGDTLVREIDRLLEEVRALHSDARRLPPVACVRAELDGPCPGADYQPRWYGGDLSDLTPDDRVLYDAASYPLRDRPARLLSTSLLPADGRFGRRVYALYAVGADGDDPGDPGERGSPSREAGELAERVFDRLRYFTLRLPAPLAGRLGLPAPPEAVDWRDALFHLGGHFPHHPIGGERCRVVAADRHEFPHLAEYAEVVLQLGLAGDAEPEFPRVVAARVGPDPDVAAASVHALELVRGAAEAPARTAGPPREEWDRLRDQFLQAGKRCPDLSAEVVLVSRVFPPAPREPGGGPPDGRPRWHVLSHRGAAREVCVFRGAGVAGFRELADRAGGLLPAWPADPYPGVFRDGEGTPPGGMVTDHRDNVGRWVGWVVDALRQGCPEEVVVRRDPDPVLTLRGLDPFQASARAIEVRAAPRGSQRVRCDRYARAVLLDGKPVASGLDEAAFAYFEVLAECYPDPITFAKMQDRATPLKGVNQSRLKNNLLPALERLVKCIPNKGHVLDLPT